MVPCPRGEDRDDDGRLTPSPAEIFLWDLGGVANSDGRRYILRYSLALIAEQPRHGYELIKLIEDKTRGAYCPSPGVVYPTLTFLEEAGYVTAESEGAKKRYTITDEGRAYLEENRDIADMVLARLAAIGEKLSRMRRKWSAESDEEESVPRLVNAALDNLREVAAKRLETSEDAEAKIVEILARAAQEIRGA